MPSTTHAAGTAHDAIRWAPPTMAPQHGMDDRPQGLIAAWSGTPKGFHVRDCDCAPFSRLFATFIDPGTPLSAPLPISAHDR